MRSKIDKKLSMIGQHCREFCECFFTASSEMLVFNNSKLHSALSGNEDLNFDKCWQEKNVEDEDDWIGSFGEVKVVVESSAVEFGTNVDIYFECTRFRNSWNWVRKFRIRSMKLWNCWCGLCDKEFERFVEICQKFVESISVFYLQKRYSIIFLLS